MKTKNLENMQLLRFSYSIILLTLFLGCTPTKIYGNELQKTPSVTQSNDIFVRSNLFFDINTSVLSKNSVEQLKHIAIWMKAHPTTTVVIEGYGDNNKSFEHNLALAEQRAKTTADYLIRLEIAPSRLKTVSDGEKKPENEHLTQNRGVQLVAEGMEKSISPRRVFSWQKLYALNDEKYGYATYSYILTGQSTANQNNKTRYLKLIEAVTGRSKPDQLIKSSLRGYYNLFIIPSVKEKHTGNDKPNYSLSRQLLDNISIKTPQHLFNQSGPYIITLYKPIGEGDPNTITDILYVDLTNVEMAAFPEFVRSYKSHIANQQIQGIEKLNSLRANLLNLMLVTEECIGFAKIAYADLQRSFLKNEQDKSQTQKLHATP